MLSFLTSIFAWFANSRVGQVVAEVIGAICLLALFVWRVFAAGKASAKADQDKASAENLRERAKTDDTIAQLSDTQRRHHLREWVRDDER